MSTLKKFLFFLVEADGRSRQIVNGIVTSLSAKKQLPQAPDGCQEISIGYERNAAHGSSRAFSLALGFLFEGYTILKNDFYKFNIDRELFLLVKQLAYEYTDTTFKEYYKQLYKGELDFSTGQDDQGDKRFTINIMEGGLQKLMKAGEGTNYEIRLPDSVQMDGMFIAGLYNWNLPEFEQLSEGYPGMYQQKNDNRIPGLATFDVMQALTGTFEPPTADSLEYFLELTQDIAAVRFTGLIENLNHNGAPGNVGHSIQIYNKITDTVRAIIDLSPDDPYPENANLPIDVTFDLLAGDRVFYKANGAFSQGTFAVSAKSKPTDSVVPIITVYDCARELVRQMTGSADNFESEFLQTIKVGLTSGDGVRALPNAVLKTNWRDLRKFLDVHAMVSEEITDKVRIFPRLTAYDNTKTAIPIGDIKGLKVTRAVEYLGTRVKVGHAEPQTDDENGKYDFTGPWVFTTPIKRLAEKEIDLQSPYKTSPWEMEQMRANYEGKVTTDRNTDNAVYALALAEDAASNEFETTAVFSADGGALSGGRPLLNISAPTPLIRAGQKIRITGSALNDQDLTIWGAGTWFFGQLIVPNESLVDETIVTVTLTILEGRYYTLDRSIPIDQLTDPDVDTDVKDSVYNVAFSPKRILSTHKSWLAGVLYQYDTDSLKFASANRNKELIADGLTEKADVQVADLGAPMFLPWIFEFDAVSPIDLVQTMDDDPVPVFSFEWENVTYRMFHLRCGIALNDRQEQTFRGLACPDNDMTDLI